MKKAISIVLVFLLIFSNLSRIWILVDFAVNQDFIATVLCINKDKPELQCNGKCHLANQIKQQEEKENSGTAPESKTKTEIIFIHHQCLEIPVANFTSKYPNTIGIYTPIFNSSAHLDRLFRPPQIS